MLLCVVRWVHPERKTKPYALAEVSLTEAAVRWRDYATVDAARAEQREVRKRQRCHHVWHVLDGRPSISSAYIDLPGISSPMTH